MTIEQTGNLLRLQSILDRDLVWSYCVHQRDVLVSLSYAAETISLLLCITPRGGVTLTRRRHGERPRVYLGEDAWWVVAVCEKSQKQEAPI
jgi:hypothetical protein